MLPFDSVLAQKRSANHEHSRGLIHSIDSLTKPFTCTIDVSWDASSSDNLILQRIFRYQSPSVPSLNIPEASRAPWRGSLLRIP